MNPSEAYIGQRVYLLSHPHKHGVLAGLANDTKVHVMVNWEDDTMVIPRLAVELGDLDPTPDLTVRTDVETWLTSS